MERSEQQHRAIVSAMTSSSLATAETLGGLGLHGQAAAYCEKALALDPAAGEIVPRCVRHLATLAKLALENGKSDLAELALRRIWSFGVQEAWVRADLAEVLAHRGVAFLDADQPVLAESAIREACHLAPDLTTTRAALTQLNAADLGAAIDAETLLPQLKMGRVTRDNARVMEAFVRRVQAANPDMRQRLDPLLSLALYQQGKIYFGTERAMDAVIALRKAIAVAPQDSEEARELLPACLYNLAVNYFNHGRAAEAEGCLWEALSLRPDFAPAAPLLRQCASGLGLALFNVVEPEYAEPAREIMSLLRVADVEGERFIRKGSDFDGGYVMIDSGLSDAVAYSLGISTDVTWDLAIAGLGTEIFQYDHTIDSLPENHPRFHWSKVGIAGKPSTDPTFQTLTDLIAKNGHARRRDLILKTDIEGAEWEMFLEMDPATLGQFSQIVGEFHGFLRLMDKSFYKTVRDVLAKLNEQFQLVHVHANNYGARGFFGGAPIAHTYEFTYVRKAGRRFAPCSRQFPTSLDNPNNKNLADYYLGTM